MFERPAYEIDEFAIETFAVSPEASYSLATHLTTIEPVEHIHTIWAEMEQADEELPGIIHELADYWELDEAEHFIEGFAIAYKLLDISAGIDERPLPVIDFDVLNNYFAQLNVLQRSRIGYIDSRLAYYIKKDSEFAEGMLEYLKNYRRLTVKQINEFFLGAASAYDTHFLQTVADQVIESYMSDTDQNQGPA
jgi:hypothetical protein